MDLERLRRETSNDHAAVEETMPLMKPNLTRRDTWSLCKAFIASLPGGRRLRSERLRIGYRLYSAPGRDSPC